MVGQHWIKCACTLSARVIVAWNKLLSEVVGTGGSDTIKTSIDRTRYELLPGEKEELQWVAWLIG